MKQKPLRLEQRKGESADMFAIRAFGMALPRMEMDHFLAFADYLTKRAEAERRLRSPMGAYWLRQEATPRLVDGLACVPWIKDYRNKTGCTLSAAKGEWDKRAAELDAAPGSPSQEKS